MSPRLLTALCLWAAVAAAGGDPGAGILRIREPRAVSYRLPEADGRSRAGGPWLEAVRIPDGAAVEFGPRLVVRARESLAGIRSRLPDGPVSPFDPRTLVVDLHDARSALAAAAALAGDPGVEWAAPVRRHRAFRHAPWGPPAADPYFDRQYPLDATGDLLGFPPAAGDLNLRGAWPWTRGEGVIIGFFDDGLDTGHPDLVPNLAPELHRNFFTDLADGRHSRSSQYHGTAVAGLAAARGDNGIGIAGTAPAARIAARVIFDGGDNLPDTARLAEAFRSDIDRVAVQNHSWGNADFSFLEPTAIERIAISNALATGREGRGVVMVRSAGNTRVRNYFGSTGIGDINADGFGNEPGAIVVASVRRDGRVAGYSTPGAAVLVAAPGGETAEGSQLFTLDPVGDAGRSTLSGSGLVLADYLYGSRSTPGTSFAAPHVSGIAALMLGINPQLHYRDVQVLLALASRPADRTEPQREPNAAGLSWSPDTGYGVPDAGEAVRRSLALGALRPRIRLQRSATGPVPIPDDGLAVLLTADGADTVRIPAAPGTGRHPDQAAGPPRRVVDVGTAAVPIQADLTGAAALIQRSSGDITTAINRAADAGAGLAVVVHDAAGNSRGLLAGTDGVRIPAVLVGRTDGDAIRAALARPGQVHAGTVLDAARFSFAVEDGLVVDSVQVRLEATHPRAGDLRLTVRSPAGTVSVLQRATYRTGAQAAEWWYSSKQFLLEGGRGTWEVTAADEAPGSAGEVAAVELILVGTAIDDGDADGLDDGWERGHWGNLGAGPGGDPDGDGWSNAAEQFLGTAPGNDDRILTAELSPTSDGRLRLSWPVGLPGDYEVQSASDPAGPFDAVGIARREPPESAWFLPGFTDRRFLRLRRVPTPP